MSLLLRFSIVLTALAASSAWAGDVLEVPLAAEPYGTFDGVAYMKYRGRFVGGTANGPYRVPYEVVAPEIPLEGNARVLLEPPHFFMGAGTRNVWFGPEFLFSRGFSHAQVGWSTRGLSILDPAAPDVFLSAPDGTDDEIVADFAAALRADPVAQGLLGSIQRLYAIGFSQSSQPLHRLLHSGILDRGQLDLTILFTIAWYDVHEPVQGAGRIIVLNTEGDVVARNAAALRRNHTLFPNYRLYEVAGGAHVPGPAFGNPLDWTPLLRAIFVAGNLWVTRGIEPPPSTLLEEKPKDSMGQYPLDPVYSAPQYDPVRGDGSALGVLARTGIVRDENLNAIGGMRMPDVAVGRAQFIAVIPSPLLVLGTFIDLQCELMPDGSVRFPNHGSYVSASAHAVNRLVKQRFLLEEEAAALVEQAAESNVGKRAACR